MSRFPKPKSFNSEPTNDDGWIWGNNRGGCGEPVRDRNGNVVTNLKLAKNSQDRNNYNNYDDYNSNNYNNYNAQNYNANNYHSHQPPYPSHHHNPPPQNYNNYDRERDYYRGGDGRDLNSSYSSYQEPTSPKRFSALKEMTSSLSPQQKNQKLTKELEYREQLRLQIEEKNRQKLLEKEKINEEKRREYELYHLNGERRSTPPRDVWRNNDRSRDRDISYVGNNPHYGGNDNFSTPPRQLDRNVDRNVRDSNGIQDRGRASGAGGRVIPGLENHQYNNSSEIDSSSKNYRSPSLERENFYDHNNYNENYDHNYDRRSVAESDYREGSVSDRGRESRFISVEEYDELNNLCNRLMSQQEKLQDEIKQQNEIIKSLQMNSNLNGRSRSVQQQRGVNDARSKLTAKPRPSSTNTKKTTGSSQSSNLNSKNVLEQGKKIQENRKNIKVAFGCSVIKDDKKKFGNDVSAQPARGIASTAGAFNNNSPNKSKPSFGGVPRGLIEERGAGNAFNRLLNAGKGPVEVTYEDENAMEPSRVAPLGMIELKNSSQFVPIKDKKVKKK